MFDIVIVYAAHSPCQLDANISLCYHQRRRAERVRGHKGVHQQAAGIQSNAGKFRLAVFHGGAGRNCLGVPVL